MKTPEQIKAEAQQTLREIVCLNSDYSDLLKRVCAAGQKVRQHYKDIEAVLDGDGQLSENDPNDDYISI